MNRFVFLGPGLLGFCLFRPNLHMRSRAEWLTNSHIMKCPPRRTTGAARSSVKRETLSQLAAPPPSEKLAPYEVRSGSCGVSLRLNQELRKKRGKLGDNGACSVYATLTQFLRHNHAHTSHIWCNLSIIKVAHQRLPIIPHPYIQFMLRIKSTAAPAARSAAPSGFALISGWEKKVHNTFTQEHERRGPTSTCSTRGTHEKIP